MAQDFVTNSHNDYAWPFGKPVVARPCEPPRPSVAARPPLPRVAPYCHCDSHAYSPQEEQYQQLMEKERQLCKDYSKLQKQLVDVTNDILDHPCDDSDTKMATIYQISYTRRGFPIVGYRPLMAASQSNAPIPMKSSKLGRLRCYRDPTTFTHTHSPTVRPAVQPATDAHTAVTPTAVLAWFADFPGRTEYQDTYSKMAKASWRATQRYREPAPSARLRADDKCL